MTDHAEQLLINLQNGVFTNMSIPAIEIENWIATTASEGHSQFIIGVGLEDGSLPWTMWAVYHVDHDNDSMQLKEVHLPDYETDVSYADTLPEELADLPRLNVNWTGKQ